jgi:hypothetical protein
MNDQRAQWGLLVLQWVLGLVILAEGAVFAFSLASAHAFAGTGLPHFIRPALAWAEMVAAVLFLIPRGTIAGGWCLITVLAGAVVLHILHGQTNVGPLVIYVAATWAVIAGKSQPARG